MFKIGNFSIKNPYILAPMAGVSQMPFRRIALMMGAGLAPTELISAKGLFYGSARTKSYLTFDKDWEKPFCVQLFGGEPEPMAIAAEKAMEMGADIIDINMGCPVKKVTKINAGSALLCDPWRAADIIAAMLKRTGGEIPITAKIRSGWDGKSLNYLEVGRALEDAGASAIALHARTRAQGYSGKAIWDHIADLKAHLTIPVIGNGDVSSLGDAAAMLKKTRCDAVMIGRAALGNPWIFRELAEQRVIRISAQERWSLVREHLSAHIDLQRSTSMGEGRRLMTDAQAMKSFRSHLIWYSRGLIGGSRFRSEVVRIDCPSKTSDLIDDFFTKACEANEQFEQADGIDYRQAFG